MSAMPQPLMPKVWRVETKPHKFCPGCGHPLVLKVLGECIEELKLEDRIAFGCDIGCSLLAWDFFNLILCRHITDGLHRLLPGSKELLLISLA